MAATNYAIEGATGQWSSVVCSRDTYENSFEPSERKKAMKWLKLHAEYDDSHPWEAMEIICTILGNNPSRRGIRLLTACIRKSYEYMARIQDLCLESAGAKHRSGTTPIGLSKDAEIARADQALVVAG